MIIRGTTPTIKYTFTTITPSEITAAYMTIKKGGAVVVEKTLEEASVGEADLSWTLTQAETLTLAGTAEIMLNWKLSDGTRGASAKTQVSFEANHIEEVI